MARGGARVALASGRPYFAAQPIIESLGIEDPCMFFGGAAIVDARTGSPLIQFDLPAVEVRMLVDLFESEGFHVEIYSAQECLVQKRSILGNIHEQYLGRAMRVIPFDEVLGQEKILKIVVVAEGREEEKRLRALLADCQGYSVGTAYGAGHPNIVFANITSQEASRENCFSFFMEHFGAQSEYVMAFGDGEADIPFLRRAGIGVAMGNARPEVKMAARFVTKSVDEQGVAYALARLCGVV